MGLLDGLGSVLGDVLQGKEIDFMSVGMQIFNNAGGLNGIVNQLNEAGLGQQVASWIGTGANLPVSADQISSALSSGQIEQLASSFGVDVGNLPQLLAQYLPKAIDSATPDGQLPT